MARVAVLLGGLSPERPVSLSSGKGCADALRRLADDPDLRRRLGVAGQQRWANEFRIGPVAARMQALYESVLR